MSKEQEDLDAWVDFMTNLANNEDREVIFTKKEVLEMEHTLRKVIIELKHRYNSKLPEGVLNKLHDTSQKLLLRTKE